MLLWKESMRGILGRWMPEQCRRSWRRHWKGILERRQQVLSRKDIECLAPEYYEINYMDDRDVSIMSRNTRHMWHIHNPKYPLMGSCIIFHKHKVSHPYHQHGRSNMLRQAVRSIKRHDKWQMGGRK